MDQVPGHRAARVLQGRRGEPVRHSGLELSHAHGRGGAPQIDVRRRDLDRHRRARGPARSAASSATSAATPTASRTRAPRPAPTTPIKLGLGKLDGLPVVIAVQDFDFMGGSLGMAAGEAIIKGPARPRPQKSTPFILFAASGGARMQEGILVADADAAHHHRGAERCARRSSPTSWCSPIRPPAASPRPTPCSATSTLPSPAR